MTKSDISIAELDDRQKKQLLGQLLADRKEARHDYPLSFAQERLWFLDRFQPGLAVYNIPLILVFPGQLNASALKQTLDEITRRHHILRTVFRVIDGHPRQIVSASADIDLETIDLADVPSSERLDEAAQLAAAEVRHVFDLSKGPLIRSTLIRIDDECHHLLLTMHHIVSDGWSTSVLMNEISALYEAYCNGTASPLPELAFQYSDFAREQRKQLSGPTLKRHLDYWRKQLADAPAVIDLPADRTRPEIQSFSGAWQSFRLEPAIAHSIRRIAMQSATTLFMVLLTAFKVLLSRYTGQTDILVGTPIANRNRTEIENLIGFFVNTLVIRTRLSGSLSFEDLLAEVRDVTLDAYAHQDLPFEKLVEDLKPDRNLSHNPLFQIMFTFQNTPTVTETAPPEESKDDSEVFLGTAKFDLTLNMVETGEGLSGTCEYSTDLFNHDVITRLIGHFKTLIAAISSAPNTPIAELPMLTETEHMAACNDWNDTKVDYGEPQPVHTFFETQAAAIPEHVALVFEDETLSYGILNDRANQLAHYLRRMGAQSGVRIGICMDRSFEMITSILAVMKAGGTYVPFDPTHPVDYLAPMMNDVDIRILLTQKGLRDAMPKGDWTTVSADSDAEKWQSEPTKNLPLEAMLDDDFAIFFSSGSSGQPKGSLLTGRGFLNVFNWFADISSTDQEMRVLLMTPFAFDASFKSIMAPLISGGRLVLADAGAFDPDAALSTIAREAITSTFATPSMLYVLLDRAGHDDYQSLASLKKLFFGAEATDVKKLRPWVNSANHDCDLIHIYGPSECSDVTTYFEVDRAEIATMENVPIGRPISNVRHYVVDQGMLLQPIGIAGELCIAGDALAKGYIGQSELTAERFVSNPFEDRGRMYRTGDLVCRNRDGTLSFLGRVDRQVKIRGIRVEPDALARTLEQHPDIREAIVSTRRTKTETVQLDAYFVSESGRSGTSSDIRDFLESKLPAYLLPASLTELPHMPLSTNGKVDFAALPLPILDNSGDGNLEYSEFGPIEQVLSNIWCEILDRDEILASDDFFRLGGHSLLATQVVSRVNETFELDVPIRRMFEHPTIATFAESIRSEGDQAQIEEFASLLLHVASLSDGEVQSKLHQHEAVIAAHDQ